MPNKYLQGAMLAFSTLTACSYPKPIACNANLIEPHVDKLKIEPDEKLKKICTNLNNRFTEVFDILEFSYAERIDKTKNAEYLPNQIIIYKRTDQEINYGKICRHEMIHAACDVGGYRIHRPDIAIKYYNQLLKNKFIAQIKFDDHVEIISKLEDNIVNGLMSISDEISENYKNDLLNSLLKIRPYIKNLFQITFDANFKSFDDLKLHYSKVLKSSDKIDEILNYLILIADLVDKKHPELEICKSLKKVKKILYLLTVRWLYVINPEEVLAESYESENPSEVEKALLDLLKKYSEEN